MRIEMRKYSLFGLSFFPGLVDLWWYWLSNLKCRSKYWYIVGQRALWREASSPCRTCCATAGAKRRVLPNNYLYPLHFENLQIPDGKAGIVAPILQTALPLEWRSCKRAIIFFPPFEVDGFCNPTVCFGILVCEKDRHIEKDDLNIGG